MSRSRLPREEIQICIIAILVTCVIAANQVTGGGLGGWAGSYAYWFCRIFIQTALFIATLYTIEKYALNKISQWVIFLLAVTISLIPFALAINKFRSHYRAA